MIRQLREWTVSGVHVVNLSLLLILVAPTAQSQAPVSPTPPSAFLLTPSGIGGFGVPVDRATVVESQGLNNRALNLTSRQSAEVDKIVGTYVEERAKLAAKYPVRPGVPPSVEAIVAQDAALVAFTTALAKVMDDEQRSTWRAAQAARLPPRTAEGLRPPGH